MFRPITRIPSTDCRFTTPFFVMSISSSPGTTRLIDIDLPGLRARLDVDDALSAPRCFR